jgi:Ni/Fe-hydrogenase subunit HybB-like protein
MDTHAVNTDVPALARLQQRALIVGVLGLAAGAFGALQNPDQFLRSWLIGFLLCLGLSLGPLALLMLQHMSGGQWGLVGRRVFEAASRNLPFVALMFVPVLLGLPKLYEWARPEAVRADQILQMKAPYLNVPFFVARAVLYFAIWIGLSTVLNRWSAAQDRGEIAMTPADSRRFRVVSAPGLIAYILAMTFASTDWVMSLDPHWFSTIFGFIFVAGQGLAGFALVIAVLSMLTDVEPYATFLNRRHFLDLGKLLLAFVMLWAYFSFSQFLIIWSGNLPEEITFYIARLRNGWQYVSAAILLGHFALPFTLLLSRDLKRRPRLLARVAIIVLFFRYIDVMWLVDPMFGHQGFPLHWMSVAVPAGLVGVWFFLFARQLRSRPLLPLNDPFFKEAFAHDVH